LVLATPRNWIAGETPSPCSLSVSNLEYPAPVRENIGEVVEWRGEEAEGWELWSLKFGLSGQLHNFKTAHTRYEEQRSQKVAEREVMAKLAPLPIDPL
jgi:hypothetical protein